MKKILFILMNLLLLNPLSHVVSNYEAISNPIVDSPMKIVDVIENPNTSSFVTEYPMPGISSGDRGTKYNILSDSINCHFYDYIIDNDYDSTEQSYLLVDINHLYEDSVKFCFAFKNDFGNFGTEIEIKDWTLKRKISYTVKSYNNWNYISFYDTYFSISLAYMYSSFKEEKDFKWMLYVMNDDLDLPNDDYYDDNKSPQIEGPDIIYKSPKYMMTFDDIDSLYTYHDSNKFTKKIIDGDINGNHKYEGNGNVDGDYIVRLTATDSNGNIGIKVVNIKVYDILAPIAILDTKTILVYNNIQLELSDFIQVLKTTKLVDTNYENTYTIIEDTYSDSYLSTGNHKLSILVKSSSGNSFTHNFNIKVLTNAADLNEDANKDWTDSVGEFFNSIWLWVWDNVVKPVFKLFGYKDR